jgi:Zn-dependent protease
MPRSGGGGLRFSLFGFPVRVHLSFLVIAVLIGLSGPEPDAARAAVWVAVVLVSVLVHELGHAFAARFVGAEPSIDLYALGGLTAFAPPRPLGRVQAIGISLAGPFSGFALGLLVLSGASVFGVEHPSPFVGPGAPVVDVVIGASIWVNLYWGFVNLLPILPLDGGNVLRSMLPGDPATRDRVAAGLSLGVAVAIVLVLVQVGLEELVLIPLLLGAVNVQSLVAQGRERTPSVDERVLAVLGRLDRGDPAALGELVPLAVQLRPESRDRLKVTAVEVLARQRRIAEARHALAHLPGTAHPALYALVDAAAGDPHGITMLDEMVRAQPVPALARYAFLARLLTGRGQEVPSAYLGLAAGAQHVEPLREAQYLAHVQGDYAAAAAIGELLVQLAPVPDPWVLYNTACSWSRAGDRDRALLRLSQAVDAGWSDASQLDADQDLAPLWITDRFREIRRRLALRPSTG